MDLEKGCVEKDVEGRSHCADLHPENTSLRGMCIFSEDDPVIDTLFQRRLWV